MSTFLNRPAIVDGILKIIRNAQKEIILIVPYIKLSKQIHQALLEANKKDVEITIIYREEKLNNKEKQTLLSFNNLNLLFHPEVHAKCYFNETQMIITSMNLYDYSEMYNREMGILLESNGFACGAYKDALDEVKTIIKSARFEKKSDKAKKIGFNPSMLRPDYEKLIAPCKVINKYFDNKVFEVVDIGPHGEIRCKGYAENIDVIICPDFDEAINSETGEFVLKRAAINFLWSDDIKQMVNKAFDHYSAENRFKDFKVYWDWYGKDLTIYRDKTGQPRWKDLNFEQTIKKFKQGIELVTEDVTKVERNLRHFARTRI